MQSLDIVSDLARAVAISVSMVVLAVVISPVRRVQVAWNAEKAKITLDFLYLVVVQFLLGSSNEYNLWGKLVVGKNSWLVIN